MDNDDIVTGYNTIIKKEIVLPQIKKKEDKVEFDLNNDGVIDKKDMSIAGKTLVKGVKTIFKKK